MSRNFKVVLQVLDIPCEEKYISSAPRFLRRKDGVVLVHDPSDSSSLANIKNVWLPLVRQHAPKTVKLMLLGNERNNLQPTPSDGKHQPF
jgi:GTPase SAR1 family protein